jgi:hypothetical protein
MDPDGGYCLRIFYLTNQPCRCTVCLQAIADLHPAHI